MVGIIRGIQRMGCEKEEFYAHTNGSPDRKGWQPLKEHLQNTAKLGRKFADKLNALRGHLS
jgi:hypothetical protein